MPTKRSIIHAKAKGVDRVGSGPVQFGNDWPGLFLRGDHALKVAMCIRQVQKDMGPSAQSQGWALKFLVELAELIEAEVDER